MTDARNDIFDSRSWAVKPAVSVGTTKPRIPSSERAQMTASDPWTLTNERKNLTARATCDAWRRGGHLAIRGGCEVGGRLAS